MSSSDEVLGAGGDVCSSSEVRCARRPKRARASRPVPPQGEPFGVALVADRSRELVGTHAERVRDMCRSRKSIAEGLENIGFCLVGSLLLHWEIRLDRGENQWVHEVVTVGPNVKRSRAKAQACVQYVIDDALRCDPCHLECPGDRWNRDFLRALKARCVVMPRVAAFLEGVGQDMFDVAVVSTALALLMVEGLLP